MMNNSLCKLLGEPHPGSVLPHWFPGYCIQQLPLSTGLLSLASVALINKKGGDTTGRSSDTERVKERESTFLRLLLQYIVITVLSYYWLLLLIFYCA